MSLTSHFSLLTSDVIHATHYTFRHIIGSLAHPYITWKKLRRTSLYLPTLILLIIYSLVYSLRIPLTYPILPHLTFLAKIIITFVSAIFTYHLIVSFLYLITKNFQNQTTFKAIYNTWIYAYTPTVIWFFFAQLSYYLLPPPRHTTTLGFLFSFVFIAGTLALFAWKCLLYYFTLRITLKLTPRQTILTTIIFIPLLTTYVYGLYQLNLWRIPFL